MEIKQNTESFPFLFFFDLSEESDIVGNFHFQIFPVDWLGCFCGEESTYEKALKNSEKKIL